MLNSSVCHVHTNITLSLPPPSLLFSSHSSSLPSSPPPHPHPSFFILTLHLPPHASSHHTSPPPHPHTTPPLLDPILTPHLPSFPSYHLSQVCLHRSPHRIRNIRGCGRKRRKQFEESMRKKWRSSEQSLKGKEGLRSIDL